MLNIVKISGKPGSGKSGLLSMIAAASVGRNYLLVDGSSTAAGILKALRGCSDVVLCIDECKQSLLDDLEAAQEDQTWRIRRVYAVVDEPVVTGAAVDVIAERQRQVVTEGWTTQHDDANDTGTLAAAASAYSLYAADELNPHSQGDGDYERSQPEMWPFKMHWWKPEDPRRALVKAGALILAEIERIDRAAGVKVAV